uniref:Uncharacterized protein n=1 Tax=Anguilla anguilla TaxID=7936 RepID=A0A0E9P862_ANGAN
MYKKPGSIWLIKQNSGMNKLQIHTDRTVANTKLIKQLSISE